MHLLKRRLGLLLISLVVIVAGCAVWRQSGQEPTLRFSHEKMLHQSVECADCHTETSTSAKAGMPPQDTCMDCHEDLDKNKLPDRKVASLFREDGTFKAAKVTAISDEVIFSHKNHTVDHKVSCAECHKGIPESTAITDAVRVTMADCIACHEQNAKAAKPATVVTAAPIAKPVAVAEDCATCHQTIRKDAKPTTHAQNWTRFHGQKAKDGDQEGVNNCSLCHTQDSCASCHKTQAPANHNNQWRQRGHGVTASIDRDTCTVCHQSDTCTSCHKTTAPRSHRGQWGAPKDTHCVNCHLPVASENCSTCHQQGTPSHAKATPTPANMRATNCRACHGVAPAAKLPHADNGDDCNYCHR